MNSGIVASRYARALLKYVQEAGTWERVYSQVCVLVLRIEEIGLLKDIMEKHMDISDSRRVEILSSALGEPLDESLVRFVRLVSRQGRLGFFVRMLYSFISQYRQEYGIKVGRLITAAPVAGLKERLETVFGSRTGSSVILSEEIRPEIMGGFVFELDGYRMDASVGTAFRRIRKQLIEKNNRIV